MKSAAFDVDFDDRQKLLLAFPRILILAGEVTERAGDALIFEHFGLNVARFSMLASLMRSGGQLSMTKLKEYTLTMRSQSNITQLVDDLEKRQLVKRLLSPTDRRVWLVEITDEGRSLLGKVYQRYQQVMDELLKDFPTESVRDAVQVMIRWIWGVGEAAGVGYMKTTTEPIQE